MINMEKKIRFEVPTQVMFRSFEKDEDDVCAGIAYGNEIICACCGSVFEIDDLAELAAEDGVEQFIFSYETWVDLTHEICRRIF